MSEEPSRLKEGWGYVGGAVQKALGGLGYAEAKAGVLPLAGDQACWKKGNKLLLVEYVCQAAYRGSVVRAMLGDAILRWQSVRAADGRRPGLLLAVWLERWSGKVVEDLKEYRRLYAPELNWLVAPPNGEVEMQLGDEIQSLEIPSWKGGDRAGADVRRVNLFSLRNQWLLKLLLLPGMDGRYWGDPHKRPRSVGELAEVSGVSQPSVSEFVGGMERDGFLRRVDSGFSILNHRELLEDWSHAHKRRPIMAMGVRSIYGPEPESQLLKRVGAFCKRGGAGMPPICVGGHLGCHLLGVGRSNNRAALLHVGLPLEEAMRELDLIEDDGPSPALRMQRADYPEGVLRGCVLGADKVPVADVLQCYLDVRQSAARGLEQADHLYERVLAPHFERG